MNLTGQEKQKLSELKADHVFQGLLDKLEPPLIAPWKESEGDEVCKHHQWIYQSGQKAQYDNFMWLFKTKE